MKTSIISFLLIIVLSTTSAIAQIAQSADNAKMSYAILAGFNFQNLNGKAANGDKLTNKMLVGYHVGVNMQIPLVPEFFFQPGLMLSTKGAKDNFGSATSTIKITYLELPLNFVYKGMLGSNYVMLGFGPYVAYGIGGKVKTTGGSSTADEKIIFKNVVDAGAPSAPYFKAFDAGGNIFAGYEMASGIFLQLNTQFGMLKVNPQFTGQPNDKSSVKNTGFGLSIGYRFNKKY